MSLGELVVNLGVKADTFTVKDFTKALLDVPLSAAAAVTGLAGISVGFVSLTNDVMNMTTGLRSFTAETGLSDKALQQWQQTATNVGLSRDAATSFIQHISQLQAGFRTGYGNYAARQALARMGMGDWSGNAYEMANRIQSAALNGNPADVALKLSQAGFSGADLMMMFKTPQSARERITPTFGRGEEASIAEFQKALSELNQVTLREFARVFKEIEPYMGDLTHAMLTFVDVFGETLKYWLEVLHKSNLSQEVFKAVSLDDMAVARTMVYYGGDITYNLSGLDSQEKADRLRNERQEFEHMQAMRQFNNGGSVP